MLISPPLDPLTDWMKYSGDTSPLVSGGDAPAYALPLMLTIGVVNAVGASENPDSFCRRSSGSSRNAGVKPYRSVPSPSASSPSSPRFGTMRVGSPGFQSGTVGSLRMSPSHDDGVTGALISAAWITVSSTGSSAANANAGTARMDSATQAREMENERTGDSFCAREYGNPRKLSSGSFYDPPS